MRVEAGWELAGAWEDGGESGRFQDVARNAPALRRKSARPDAASGGFQSLSEHAAL